MSSTAPASQSSEERAIGMTTRADLVVQESNYQGERCWIVKDPLAMKYFRLKAPEHLVLESMRQSCSYLELKNKLDRAFPEQITRLESLQHLVVSLHRSGLMNSDAAGQALPLRKKRNRALKQKTIQLLSSIVSLRLPGFDPQWLLNELYLHLRWMFSTWFTVLSWGIIAAAIALVIGNLDEFLAKLPDFNSFFAFENILFMASILIFTKTIHEFGHGLVCRHFGGECHEIGFMLLVLTPAMYCNTSDSWIMPNRWHRMAVGAAGMYVELLMAAICTFIWWFTVPGWIHFLALNIMFLSSVSTVIFNANPLLRYDGYYILSDFLEIPNLAQKSKLALISVLRVWCLGMKPVESMLLPKRNLVAFALYSIASFAYRWMIMLFIFWFIKEVFEPWGLAAIGYLMISLSLFGMVVLPLFRMVKFFMYPGKLREVKRLNLAATVVVAATLFSIFCFVPFKQFVYGDCLLRARGSQVVYVQQPGTLTEIRVGPGDRVHKGQIIAVLENREFDLELTSMVGDLTSLRQDLIGYEIDRDKNANSERLITETKLAIESLQKQIRLKQLQAAPLTLRAPHDGVIVQPPNQPRRPTTGYNLRTWVGSPLDPRNIGAFLETNTVFCSVATANQFEAIVVLDQMDIKLLRPEQAVKFCINEFRDEIHRGSVVSIAKDELTEVPRELSQSNGGPIPVKSGADATERPVLKLFEVFATVEGDGNSQPGLVKGGTGVAKITVGYSTLGAMVTRYVRNIINFR